MARTSSLTLPPYIEERVNNVALGDFDAVIKLREALLKTFYPSSEDRCPMCGGKGIYRTLVGKRVVEEGCSECDGTGHGKNSANFATALEILCGRRKAPTDEIAEMSPAVLAAAVLDGKILSR